jgi:glycosyltransferase involved in cell wall biosynthesis
MIFTIAIPTYNNADTLETCIKSCLAQDFEKEYEVLVVDNNCTDNTSEILEKFKNKIQITRNKETVSMFENHNICLEYAHGDYIVFCHSDDQLLPDALTKYFDVLNKRQFPKKYVLWGRSMYRDYFSAWHNAGYSLNQIASGIHAIDPFITGGGVTPSGTCFSKKSLLEIGGFVKSKHPLSPCDWITSFKLVVNHFEFEMCDRIFFHRTYASTANFTDPIEHSLSIENAMDNLFKSTSNKQKRLIINQIISSEYFNQHLIKYLNINNLVDKKILRKKVIKYYLRNLWLLRHTSNIKFVLSLF